MLCKYHTIKVNSVTKRNMKCTASTHFWRKQQLKHTLITRNMKCTASTHFWRKRQLKHTLITNMIIGLVKLWIFPNLLVGAIKTLIKSLQLSISSIGNLCACSVGILETHSINTLCLMFNILMGISVVVSRYCVAEPFLIVIIHFAGLNCSLYIIYIVLVRQYKMLLFLDYVIFKYRSIYLVNILYRGRSEYSFFICHVRFLIVRIFFRNYHTNVIICSRTRLLWMLMLCVDLSWIMILFMIVVLSTSLLGGIMYKFYEKYTSLGNSS